ncbi:putative transmembrane ascorbate ferrireductase 4 [Morella rubra]|uniref:Putative transmembrane ascorbate ferrireductase 4 n=1 Tax=Morella rubra TaxID=262757 RepID=A0A6A1W0N4_9ROSI|nr:putative transmembrane ascorbate ferrireductase 4 [Morella rubra]
MALGSPSLFPLLFFARVSGLAVAVLVLFWVLAFKSNFLPRSSSQEHLIFAALHPLLMVIGFILISGEVAGGFPELLAPRGGTHSEAEAVALARFPGALYLWSGGGHSRNWAAGEVDIFADQEKRTQTLSRVNGAE